MKVKGNKKWTKEEIENRVTLIWDARENGELSVFLNVACELEYNYVITGHRISAKIIAAAACIDTIELAKTLLKFRDLNFYSKVCRVVRDSKGTFELK